MGHESLKSGRQITEVADPPGQVSDLAQHAQEYEIPDTTSSVLEWIDGFIDEKEDWNQLAEAFTSNS